MPVKNFEILRAQAVKRDSGAYSIKQGAVQNHRCRLLHSRQGPSVYAVHD